MNIIRSYKEWAPIYDSDKNLTRDLDHLVVQELLTDIKDKDIVEAGCGTGKNTLWLSTQAQRVTAFDLSEDMLKLAREKIKAKNVEFFNHDITKMWPVRDSGTDIVLINLVLEHLPSIDFVMKEAHRVLKNGGILCICELHPKKRLSGSQAKYFDPVAEKEIKVDSYLHTKQEFSESAQRAGFKETKFQDWYDEKIKEIPRLISIVSIK